MAKFVPVDPFDLVIFGGTGDLARRKLLPAMYHRDADGQLPEGSRIIAISRSAMSRDEFVAFSCEAIKSALGKSDIDDEVMARFVARLDYQQQDLLEDDGWNHVSELLAGSDRTRVYYLATSPSLYGRIAEMLGSQGLSAEPARIVLEKPVGTDLASAHEINVAVGNAFSESQIYRIDHYLGKETVQNLMALRFANSLFEPLWRREYVDHVQITVAEDLGVGTRGGFYDHTGALRDMVQNHILQLLCLVAMEPPAAMDSDEIRNEKLKVLRALRPIDETEVESKTVRGQYKSGAVDGEAVPAYIDELEDTESSNTETYVAIKAEIENWRWTGTPFYLRTGKRLASKCSEIVIQFRPIAHSIFSKDVGPIKANQLVMRLQPNEGVTMSLMTKEPGPGGFQLRSLGLDLSFAEAFQIRYPDSYERLLVEVIRGNPALFMRRDEVEAAWHWIDQIIAGWQEQKMPVSSYVAGSWGPTEAAVLIDRGGREWRDPSRQQDA